MVGSTKHKTAADTARILALHEVGCIVSVVYFHAICTPGDIHHLIDETGHRYPDEHQMTICLTPWYHRGVRPLSRWGHEISVADCERSFGPSMALNKRAFEERFGTEADLLEMTNVILRRFYGPDLDLCA